jgi:hypothetical protein
MSVRTAGVLTVAVALTLAACGSSPGPAASSTTTTTATAPSATTTSSAAPSPTADPASARRLVTEIALRDADLLKGYRVQTIEHGDEVAGQVTFDLCGHEFASEAHRTARHQGGIVSGSGESQGASNEVVAYDSEAAAKAALAEFRDAVRACPKNREVPAGIRGGAPRRYLAATVRTEAALPAKDNALAVLTLRKANGSKLYQLLIVQRQGAVLDNLYVSQPERVIASDEQTAVGVAAKTGRRLVQLAG